jgi:hypothetical protein
MNAVCRDKFLPPVPSQVAIFVLSLMVFSRRPGTVFGKLQQRAFRNQFRNEFRKVSMHFDNSKADKDRRNGDGVRRKVTRWGGSDPPCAAIQPPKPFWVRGSLPARASTEPSLRCRHSQTQNQKQIRIRNLKGEPHLPFIQKVENKLTKKKDVQLYYLAR